MARPQKYSDEELIEKIVQIQENDPLVTIHGICTGLKVHRDYLNERSKKCSELSVTLKKIEEIRIDAWIKLGVQACKGKIPNFNQVAYVWLTKNIVGFRDDPKDSTQTGTLVTFTPTTEQLQSLVDQARKSNE